MESEIIINPAKNNSELLKTDGTLITTTNNIDNIFDKVPLYDQKVKYKTKNDLKKIDNIDNIFDGVELGSIPKDGKSILKDEKENGHKQVREESNEYFTEKLKQLKKFAVGDKAEWNKYWEIALGQSVVNLGMEYHFDKQMWGAVDWETAFGPELEDTGFVEGLFFKGAKIIADLPTLIPGGYLGGIVGGRFGGGYGAGFLTESLRTTYHQALQEGNVDSFSEWWEIFTDEGIAAGHQAGITLGLTLGLPKALPLDELLLAGHLTKAQHYVANVLTQYATFQGMGYYYNGKLPDGEDAAQDLILFSLAGIPQTSGARAVNKARITEKKSAEQVIKEKQQQVKDAEILYSKNQDTFVRTTEGHVSGKPLEYVSVELLREKVTTNKKFVRQPTEFEGKALNARELARREKYTELDKKLEILEGKIARGVISELEGRKQFAKIEAGFSKLAREKGLDLKVEPTEIVIDKTKSKKYQESEAYLNEKHTAKGIDDAPLNYKETTAAWLDRHKTLWWDQIHPVKKGQVQVINKGNNGKLSPYEMARLLKAVNRMAESFIFKGIFKDTKGTARHKSYVDIIKDNFDTALEIQQARNLLIARRIVELYERGTKGLYQLTKKDYEMSKANIAEASNKVVKGANEIVKYEKQMLKWMFDNKYIDKTLYKLLLETGKDYIPLAREGKSFQNPFFKLKGKALEESRIIDPITTIANNTVLMAQNVYRNNMLREFFEPFRIDRLKGKAIDIKFIEKKAGKVVTVPKQEIARVLGLTKDQISGFKLNDAHYQFFALEYNFQKNNTIFYRDAKGKHVVVEVPPDLYLALKGTNPGYQFSVFSKTIFSGSTKIAKNTITMSLPFAIRNLIRDTKVAAIVSKNPNYFPFYQMARGLFLASGKKPFSWKKDPNKLLEEYISRGGFESHFFKMQKYSDPKIQKLLSVKNRRGELVARDIFGTKQNKRSELSYVQAFLIRIAETSEIAAKLAEFELTIKNVKKARSQGKNNMTDAEIMDRALFEAKNLMDFSKAGLKAELWNHSSMFFNARLRGMDKTVEAFTQRPFSSTAKSVAYTTTPYFILWLLNHADDAVKAAYDAQPQWMKDTGYLIHNGDGTFTFIPGEWGLFQVFAAQLGAWLEYWKENGDPEDFKQFYKDAAKRFVMDNVSSFMPDLVRMAVMEQTANYDNFYQSPVVGPEHEAKLPQDQYTPQTSFLGKKLGKILKYSPIKIDKFIESQFNAYGRAFNDVIDYAAEKFGYQERIISPFDSRWLGPFDQNKFVKVFFIKNNGKNSDSLRRIWKTFKLSQKTYRSVEFLKKGNQEQINRAIKLQLSYEYQIYKIAQDTTEQISKAWNFIKIIEAQPNSEYKRLKNESNREYENRILAEKDEIIQVILGGIIDLSEQVDLQLRDLKKQYKKDK